LTHSARSGNDRYLRNPAVHGNGTFAGLKTDDSARGLYAAGADMASVMGGHYPAGGTNLGPAMTFGYIAGRHAAGATRDETTTRPFVQKRQRWARPSLSPI
jgi:succinate dehydrogenase/fumarate reductase flavoprotein subunit